MKKNLLLFFFFTCKLAFSQEPTCENIFIITIDGFRWQELFYGADSQLIKDTRQVQDTAMLQSLFWDERSENRRKLLMPFCWNYLASKGRLWGNRQYDNAVEVANPYRLSFAGYHEIFTGFADPSVITNKAKPNKHEHLLSFLNNQPRYEGKVVSFTSWGIFQSILKGGENVFGLHAGYQTNQLLTSSSINADVDVLLKSEPHNPSETRPDEITQLLALDYVRKNHPKVVHIGFGEADELAHHKMYDQYLYKVNQMDHFIAECWNLIQNDPFYKNKTSLLITSDHGRGAKAQQWDKHGALIKGANETWLIQMGPGIKAQGEMKTQAVIYADQLAQTIAHYLGLVYEAKHPIEGPSYELIGMSK